MNISLENVDKVSAVLTLKMEKADYQDNVTKALKKLRQKANIPGFRPGQVPMSIIQKRFGKDVLAEEVNKILSEKLYGYIRENQVNMLGEPMVNAEQPAINFDTDEEFTFIFDIALAPELNVEVSSSDVVPFYNIEVTEELIDEQIAGYAQQAGSHEKADSYEAKDMLKGLLAELDEAGNTKEGGIQVENAVMMPEYFQNDEQKAIFAGCKVNDVVTFNPSVAYEGRDADMTSLLKITKEEVAEMKSNFSFQVEEITRFVSAEVNQALFDKVFGEGVVTNEEEFRAKVKETIGLQFGPDQDYKFLLDLRTVLMGKNEGTEFPEALLKRIMQNTKEDATEEDINANYEKSITELTWHLIKEKLTKVYEIKVEEAEVRNMAKEATRAQFAQYGMANVPENLIEQYAETSLKKQEMLESYVNRCVEWKLAKAIKPVVTLEEKTVTPAEFNALFA